MLGLVNNDVEVLDAGWLDEMVSLALDPAVGCVGAKLYYPDGRLQHGGVVTGVGGAAGHRYKRAARTERGMLDSLVTVNEVSAVTAACLVVRKAVYFEVGGLDADTFAVAYNDVDFCLKVAAAGYRNLWTPFAELNHHESVSRGRDLSPRTAERFNRENLEPAAALGRPPARRPLLFAQPHGRDREREHPDPIGLAGERCLCRAMLLRLAPSC